MRLLINTATTHKGGGVQVAKSFIEECRDFNENEYYVILGIGLAKLINENDYPSNFKFYKIAYRPAEKVFSLQDQAKYFKNLETQIKPDVVFTTSGPAYWRPKVPHLMGYNLPHYIYQDSPFFNLIPKIQKLKWWAKGKLIKYYTKRDADAYVVQTDDVNNRLKNWIKKSVVYTVTNTYGAQYDKEDITSPSLLPPKEIHEFRLLLLSSYYLHKNIEIINDICEIIAQKNIQNIKFVLTLPQNELEKIFTTLAKKYIINMGSLHPDNCPQLYKECDMVFLPTLLECFSATYAEGMKMGLPILTTDLGFAHTVCGNAASYFEPTNAKDAVQNIIQIMENQKLRLELVENGKLQLKIFNNAHQRAEKYLHICASLIK